MVNTDLLLRIRKLMNHFDASSSQFADMIGMDRSGFSKRMNGHVAIGDAVLNKIVIALPVNKEWLKTGLGEMIKNTNERKEEINVVSDFDRNKEYSCKNCNDLKKELDQKCFEIDELKSKLIKIYESYPETLIPEGVPKKNTG